MQELVVSTIEHLTLFKKSIISIGNADALVKLLESVFNNNVAEIEDCNVKTNIQKSICEVSKAFLRIEWRNVNNSDVEKGAKLNLHVESILGLNL